MVANSSQEPGWVKMGPQEKLKMGDTSVQNLLSHPHREQSPGTSVSFTSVLRAWSLGGWVCGFTLRDRLIGQIAVPAQEYSRDIAFYPCISIAPPSSASFPL